MPTITGTPGNDTLNGTAEDDTISGGAGFDLISAGGGNDIVDGGLDGDTINGGAGDDIIHGGEGSDVISDGRGADQLFGDGGNDSFNINLSGGGRLTADGGTGDDSFLVVDGGGPNQSVTLIGGEGNDSIRLGGFAVGNIIDAGSGDDVVRLGSTLAAQITLGTGADTLVLQNDYGGTSGVVIADWELGVDDFNANLSQILSGWDGVSNPFAGGFLRLTQSGADTILQIDANGGGDAYTRTITFANTDVTFFARAEFASYFRDVKNDFNGDGRSDILWRNDNGFLTSWLGQADGGFTDNGADSFAGVATSWSVTGTGDFNGDGRDDILWRNDNGFLTSWVGQANGGFADNGANSFASVDASWSVTGTGDFNGDGRDDILWRNDNGFLTSWLGQADGGFTDNGANSFASVATSWSVSGVGDFNGDGRDDILWRNDNGFLTSWLGQTDGGFVDNGANSFASVATSWSVTGVGDFNGDGRDDILWRNDNGLLTSWLGQTDGGFVDNGANSFASVATSWSVTGVGDFNGDGRDDILWRNDNGFLTSWLGQADGGFADNGANSFASVATTWHVQPEPLF